MELKNSFEVRSPLAQVWDFLLNVEEVVPCVPGAELTEVVDERNFKGRVNVKLGPVSLSYAGTVILEASDEERRRVVLKAKGTEKRGKGMAQAVVTSQLSATDGTTQVEILTDLKISGQAAQFGRGMLADVSERFTADFARAVAARLEPVPSGAAEKPVDTTPSHVSGIRIGLWALWRAVVRGIKRLFGRAPQ